MTQSDSNKTASVEDDEMWDYDHAEQRSGTKAKRAVVSIAFQREDFERIATASAAAKVTVSEFIRTAALAKARQPKPVVLFGTTSTSGAVTLTTSFVPTRLTVDKKAVTTQ